MMCQLLQYLGHQGRGNTVFLGDLVGATGVLLAMQRQVLDSNQAVVGLFGKLEHRSGDSLYAPEYATDSVAVKVYSPGSQMSTQNLYSLDSNSVFAITYYMTKIVFHVIE